MITGEWIGEASATLNVPKQGRWIARPRKSRWVLQAGVGFAFVGPILVLVHLVLKPWLNGARAWVTVGTIVLLLLLEIGLLSLSERRAGRMRAADRALLDASFGEQFAIEITIIANGKRLGSDVGVAWFADGVMGFSGSASSFVLAAWDVEVVRKAIPAQGGTPAVPQGALLLRNTPVPAYLIATTLAGTTKAFRDRFNDFLYETAPRDAERFWPPLVPYVEAPSLEKGERNEAIGL